MRQMWHGSQTHSTTNTDFVLGSLTATSQEHGRRITASEQQYKDLKAEFDRMKTWLERFGILIALYALGAGLHLGAGLAGPLVGATIRAAIGLR